MSTIITILIIAIIAALVIVGLKETERSIGRCGFKAWRGTC